MNPKEKAEELIQFYRFGDNIVYNWTTDKKELIGAKNIYYKECALKVVDEILTTLNYDIRDLDVRGSVLLDLISYWREVKQELEKL